MPANVVDTFNEQDREILSRLGVVKKFTPEDQGRNLWYMIPRWNVGRITQLLEEYLRENVDLNTDPEFIESGVRISELLAAVFQLQGPYDSDALKFGMERLVKEVKRQLAPSATGLVQSTLNGNKEPRWLIRRRWQGSDIYAVTAASELVKNYYAMPARERDIHATETRSSAHQLLLRRVPELAAFEVAVAFEDVERRRLAAELLLDGQIKELRSDDDVESFKAEIEAAREDLRRREIEG